MIRLHDAYTREIYDALGYFAAWPPGARVTPGDVGLISGRRFRRETSLTELGVKFATSARETMGDLEYATNGLVKISSNAEGEVSDAAAAKVSITFAAAGATFFQAGDCVTETITNLPALARILTRKPEWERRYVVITEVVRCCPIVVFVSSERGAEAELHVSSDAATGRTLLTNAKAGLTFATRRGFAANLVKEDGGTPLFQAMQLRRRPRRGNIMEYRHEEFTGRPSAPANSATDLLLRRLVWNDFAADA